MKTESVIAAAIMFLLVGVVSVSAVMAYQYKSAIDRADKAERQVNTQAAVIAAQQTQIVAFNHLSASATQQNATVVASSEEKVIEYRTILRTEKTCNLPVPADVTGGLLSYTNSLRASAMHTTASGTDATSTATITTSKLTYCQAVLWIHPLLTAIAQANNQLSAIRQAELLRQGK
ncbi:MULTISPECIES: hypothetical protein [unclassified Tatumella]|uniref:hypothetical protein n=1 Tax=unclassified Tatumella TaxID=2649542 RepID=UPI001BB0B2B2|nr:hypothetical protein [Tatumella sp. JGM82]MBS0892071.1 hypothetical protein [Tatumella sp. JGM94]MBS0900850.1 hypothetical protein [Tatumella sp. JGM100]